MGVAAIFVIISKCKSPTCPLTVRWINCSMVTLYVTLIGDVLYVLYYLITFKTLKVQLFHFITKKF